jgi:pyridoxal biosynthesis lyase PdxS
MSDPAMVSAIKQAVTIPVMAKCRIGHFVEAQVLEALAIDYIDESEVSPMFHTQRTVQKFIDLHPLAWCSVHVYSADESIESFRRAGAHTS